MAFVRRTAHTAASTGSKETSRLPERFSHERRLLRESVDATSPRAR